MARIHAHGVVCVCLCVCVCVWGGGGCDAALPWLRFVFPNATRVNRGNMTVKDLVETCRGAEFSDIVVVQETRGEPDGCVCVVVGAGGGAAAVVFEWVGVCVSGGGGGGVGRG